MFVARVDGVRSLPRAYDLDRGSKRAMPTVRFANAQMTRFDRAHNHRAYATVPADASLLSSAQIWASGIARISTFPIPADGVGGLRLR